MKTHIPMADRLYKYACKDYGCTCHYNFKSDSSFDLKVHKKSYTPRESNTYNFMCDKCDFGTDRKSAIKLHKNRNRCCATAPASDSRTKEDVQTIKVEPIHYNALNLQHCFDNRAPLHLAHPTIKLEFTEINKTAYTCFSKIKTKIIKNDKARIRKAMSFYKQLDNDDRERYLNERMLHQNND